MYLFYGLWGVSGDGVLSTPAGRRIVKLPRRLAFKIHSLLNRFAYVGKIEDANP